jgi:hypothetical protein
MKTHHRLLASLILVICTAAAEAAPTTGQPAVWTPHELIVDLRDLPRHYTCDDLWYKFKGILSTLGARQDMEILPYRCESNSPKVQVKFSTPRLVPAAQAKWADLNAVEREVQIRPGAPEKLDSGDCELMSQVKSSLLKNLGTEIVAYRLPCKAPRRAGEAAFNLTAKVLQPVPAAAVASR